MVKGWPRWWRRALWALIMSVGLGAFAATWSLDSAEARPRGKGRTKASPADGIDPQDAAFIIVRTSFKSNTVTINGQPYPQHSEVGAMVASGRRHEVVVTHTGSNFTKRYDVVLQKGEARILVVDLSGATNKASAAPTSAAPVQMASAAPPPLESKEDPVAEVVDGAGFLTVNSNPSGQVYIDGKLVASKTPLTRFKVDNGNHTVRVYFVDLKKFSEPKRAMVSDGRHLNLYFDASE